jgi:hypothetical protein
MRASSNTLFLAFITNFFFAAYAAAEPKIPLQSALLIKSNPANVCASAVAISAHTLLTAAHFAESSCLAGSCPDIYLAEGAALEEFPNPVAPNITLKVWAISSAFDLAILETPETVVLTEASLGTVLPGEKTNVTNIGYPGCAALKKSSGITTSVNIPEFSTDTKGKKGSSGSGLFSDDGTLIGIVTESDSLFDALLSQNFDIDFNNAGVSTKDLLPILIKPTQTALTLEAEKIANFYRKNVLPVQGMKRLWLDMKFFTKVSDFKRRIVASNLSAEAMALLNDSLPPIPPAQFTDTALGRATDVLSMLSSLERFGFAKKFLLPESDSSLINLIENSNRPKEQILKLIEDINLFSKVDYPGYELMLISSVTMLSLLLFFVTSLWGFTMGYVWHAAGGGFWSKVWWTTMVSLLLWPISFIAFWLRERRLKKKALLKKR